MPNVEEARRRAARGELSDKEFRDALSSEMRARAKTYSVPTAPSAQAVECLYVTTGGSEDGTGRQFDYIWGQAENGFDAIDCHVTDPPPQDMPKVFGCDNLTFRNGSITGVRNGAGSHVEGIHINGCRHVLFEDMTWDDNDIFHVFITQWGEMPNGQPFPNPEDITFRRCRFGLLGPGGGYYAVKVRDDGQGNYTPCPGLVFEDCQTKVAIDAPGVDLSGVTYVSPGDPWPPFKGDGGGTDPIDPPDPEPPVDDDLVARVAELEARVSVLETSDEIQDQRLAVLEHDASTLG